MKLSLGVITCLSSTVLGQVNVNPSITVPATNGSLPKGGSNGCASGYEPGSNTIIYTLPYTYQQILSIVGNYTNLTWSGSPDNSVTTNDTKALESNDWMPGDARFYTLSGAQVIETITVYEKPADGPYIEVHTVAPLTVSLPTGNLSFYSDYDAQNWTSICDGRATTTNFTVNFCATNASQAAGLLGQLHSGDAIEAGKFLGGMNFTSCEALGSSSGNGSNTTPIMTGDASVWKVSVWLYVFLGIFILI